MITEILLGIILVITALASLETRNSIRAISSFAAMNLTLSVFLLFLNAPYVAVFQLLIYFGVSLFLLLVVVGLGERKKEKIERNILLPAIVFGFFFTLSLLLLSLSTSLVGISGYDSVSFTKVSSTLWGTYDNVLLVIAYIVAFSVLGSLSIISLEEGEKNE